MYLLNIYNPSDTNYRQSESEVLKKYIACLYTIVLLRNVTF